MIPSKLIVSDECALGSWILTPRIIERPNSIFVAGHTSLIEFDLETQTVINKKDTSHDGHICSAGFNNDYIFTADAQGQLIQWDPRTLSEKKN